MHRILGGSNFAAAFNAEELEASSCTTAAVTVDHSAYWAPQLYWIVDPGNPDNTTFLQLSTCLELARLACTNSVLHSFFQPILLLPWTVSFSKSVLTEFAK